MISGAALLVVATFLFLADEGQPWWIVSTVFGFGLVGLGIFYGDISGHGRSPQREKAGRNGATTRAEVSMGTRTLWFVTLLVIVLLFLLQWNAPQVVVQRQGPLYFVWVLGSLSLLFLGTRSIVELIRRGVPEGRPTPWRRIAKATAITWVTALGFIWFGPITLVAAIQEPNLTTSLLEVIVTVIWFGAGPSLIVLPMWTIFRFATRNEDRTTSSPR
jgi:hypothetical protein